MTNLPEFLQSQRTTALATLHPLPETQEQVARFVAMAVEEALDGHTDLMMLASRLKAAKDAIDGILDGVKDAILDEAEKYTNKGQFNAAGATFELRQRTDYDLTPCEDPVLNDLENRVAARKKFLKSLPNSVFDEAAGGVEIHPPVIKVSRYYTIKKY